jgi:hypothetical protein
MFFRLTFLGRDPFSAAEEVIALRNFDAKEP